MSGPIHPSAFSPQPSGGPSPGRLLEHFRATKRRIPLHPLEKAVLAAVAIHLCFLPWALGTMHPWSQITSLVLATIGLVLALIPRTYSGDHLPEIQIEKGSQVSGFRSPVSAFRLSAWPRLLRFPIFWIGLALLGYIALQASNPSWVWTRNATTWWLVRVNDIEWLPTSIDTPFDRFNIWRQFIIYASAWLTTCTVWIGFTRLSALRLLLMTLALNAAVLVTAGFFRMATSTDANWVLFQSAPLYGATPFATFIYKNHAGAYLALCASVALGLAVATHQRSVRQMARSAPTLLWVFLYVGIAVAVFFTYSRGSLLILLGYTAVAVGVLAVHRSPGSGSSNQLLLGGVALTAGIIAVFGYAGSQLNYRRTTANMNSLLENRAKDASVAARLEAYQAGEAMLGDYWKRGVGAGGFRYLFPEYLKTHPAVYQEGRLFWEHLHRDWYQVIIELGAFGGAILLAGLAWIVGQLHRFSVFRHAPALMIVLGCLQTLLQAWFDFPLQNPAVLVTWLAVVVAVVRWLEIEPA